MLKRSTFKIKLQLNLSVKVTKAKEYKSQPLYHEDCMFQFIQGRKQIFVPFGIIFLNSFGLSTSLCCNVVCAPKSKIFEKESLCNEAMFTHTIAEFFGHILYSFTRSVAEHYNFNEDENLSALFGYNALEDTGREWYCQPVDEVIYQEYSNSEATAMDYLTRSSVNARLIGACSTEDNEETEETREDTAMAWKQLRPSIFRTVSSSLCFGFLISVLSATVIGIVSITVYYLSYQTLLSCQDQSKADSIPLKLQWVITLSKVFFLFFVYQLFFINVLFFFRPFQISGLKLRLFLLCLVPFCLDSTYRIVMQVFGISIANFKFKALQIIPCRILYYLSICSQIYFIAKHFCNRPGIKRLKLILLFVVPCVLTNVTGNLISNLIYPAYNRQDKNGKVIIAIFTPLITAFLKGASRICIQRLWRRISHPGTSFVLLAQLYCGSAVMLRLLQLDLQSLESVALIGVIHGIAEVVERSTMVLIDHFSNQVLEKRRFPLGGFRSPRRERLATDICITSMFHESSAVISVNGLLHLYQCFYTSDNSPLQLLQSFAITTSVPLVIEWFFTSVSIAIETRYQNMPIMAVWRKQWRRHIIVAVVNMAIISVWSSNSLLTVVQERFKDKFEHHCEMPFSSGG